jgi:hypothetical protein
VVDGEREHDRLNQQSVVSSKLSSIDDASAPSANFMILRTDSDEFGSSRTSKARVWSRRLVVAKSGSCSTT